MENIEIASTCSDESLTTPTQTEAELELPPYAAPAAVPPHKGATFMIRDPQTGFVITLRDGKLALAPGNKESVFVHSDDARGSHWRCVENTDRWLGFKNAVSGEFIGHDNNKKKWCFIAKTKAHKEWESFCVRQHLHGGHELLVKHWNGFRAMQIGGEDDRELVVADEGQDGVAWEFLKVYSQV